MFARHLSGTRKIRQILLWAVIWTISLLLLSSSIGTSLTASSVPSIDVSPNSGLTGSEVAVSGSGYTPGGYAVSALQDAVDAEKRSVSEAVDDFFYSDGQIPVTVALDRIGIVADQGVAADQVEAFAKEYGLEKVDEFPGHFPFFVLGLKDPLDRDGLVQFTREIKQAGKQQQLLVETGLVIMTRADPLAPILLSDEFIALFDPNVTQEQIDEYNRSNHVEIVSPDPYVPNQFVLKVTQDSGLDALAMANQYHESPLTEFSHPNFWMLEEPMETLPIDPFFGNQWHHRNTGQNGGTVDADADTSWAWDLTLGDSSVVIAVIDDGFDLTHEDLAPNLLNGWDFVPCGSGFVAGCGDSNPSPGAGDNHGTAVAGVAAARGGNFLGVTGSCPNCRIIPIRRGYSMFSVAAKAATFAYAQSRGADIINSSWGNTPAHVVTTVVRNAINNAASAGILVFFAGGNGNSAGWCSASYPSLANVIAVSSSSNQDRKVVQAAKGNCIDILAPSHRGYQATDPYVGTLNITTVDRTGAAGYNNASPPPLNCAIAEPGNRNYTHCFGGTSSASPLAAGIAGLVLSADSTLNRTQVQRLLQDTADKIEPGVAAYADNTGFSSPSSGVATHSWGRVNAFEAVRIAASVEVGGKGGVDIFLRDNRLDWGNTTGYLGEQASNVLFEPTRGFIPHWQSADIKVDRFPYQPAPTAATFDSFVDETPSAVPGETNRVYVRVRNRGPATASSVKVKLLWSQFGTALPLLPSDFWTSFPNNSTDVTRWHSLNCSGVSAPYCSISALAYSGSSVAGTPADNAQVVGFDFPAPGIDPRLDNHFCLLAIVDSPQDPIDPISRSRFVVDNITPNDNNVTHRNYYDLDTGRGMRFEDRFFVRNPTREPIRAILVLEDPNIGQRGWQVELDKFDFYEPFELKEQEEVLVTMHLTLPRLNETGDLTIIQERADTKVRTVMGGVTYRLRPKFRIYLPLIARD